MTAETTQQLEDFHLWTYSNGPALYEDEDAVRTAIDLSVDNVGLTTGDARSCDFVSKQIG